MIAMEFCGISLYEARLYSVRYMMCTQYTDATHAAIGRVE